MSGIFVFKAEREKNNIEYRYYGNLSFDKINELYNMLDLYIVSARYEGGPQSIIECALTRTPIISTKVGLAPEILDEASLYDEVDYENAIPNTELAYENVKKLMIPAGFDGFKKFLAYSKFFFQPQIQGQENKRSCVCNTFRLM